MATKNERTKNLLVWKKYRVKGSATRKNHTATLVGDKVYVYGGYENHVRKSRNDIFVVTKTKKGCSEHQLKGVTGRVPHRRNGHSAHLVDDQLFVFGGWGGSAILNEICVFDVVLNQWRWPKTYGTMHPLLNMHVAEYVDWLDSIFCFGGGDGVQFESEVYCLNIRSLVWNKPEPKGKVPPRRANASSCLLDINFCVFGGWSQGYQYNDIHLLTLPKNGSTPSWSTPLITEKPMPRVGAGLACLNGRVLLFGGKHQRSHYRDVQMFDLRSKKWQKARTWSSGSQSSTWLAMKGEVALARAGHTLTTLPDGALLVYGGSRLDTQIPGTIHTLQCE